MKRSLSKKLIALIAMTTVATTLMSSITLVGVKATEDKNISKTQTLGNEYRNVLYYEDYSIWGNQGNYYPKDIPAEKLTHLIYGGLDLDSNGELILTDTEAAFNNQVGENISYGDISTGVLQAFKVLKQNNPNLKIGISIGGWKKSGDFSQVCANPTKRIILASNIAKFLKYTDMDLVDIDWEYPGLVRNPDLVDSMPDEGCNGTPDDKYNYTLLVKDIRTQLNKLTSETGKNYEISAKLPATADMIGKSVDFSGLFNEIDFANLTTYKFREESASISGHSSPLYTNPKDPLASQNLSVDGAINTYIKNGAPSKKLVVGSSFYTQGWEAVNNTGTDVKTPGLFGSCSKVNKNSDGTLTTGAKAEDSISTGGKSRINNGEWKYGSIDKLRSSYPNLKEYWDDGAKVPYLYDTKNGAFFTYENINSIAAKSEYVRQKKLGGMMAWMAAGDRAMDSNSKKRDELVTATAKGLFQMEPVKLDQKYLQKDILVQKTVTKPEWGNGSKINIKLTNNERLVETQSTMKSLEERGKTITNYTLYLKLADGKVVQSNSDVKFIEENGYVKVNGTYKCNIKPSETISIELSTDKVITEGDILEIGITERVYKDSPEYNKTIMFNDVLTLSKVASGYNLKYGDSNYKSDYDLNKDGIIDLYDLTIISKKI